MIGTPWEVEVRSVSFNSGVQNLTRLTGWTETKTPEYTNITRVYPLAPNRGIKLQLIGKNLDERHCISTHPLEESNP